MDPYVIKVRHEHAGGQQHSQIAVPSLIAYQQERICGYTSVRSWQENQHTVYLISLNVSATDRRVGLGSRLLVHVEEYIANRDRHAILAANALSAQHEGIMFLQHHGYMQVWSQVQMRADLRNWNGIAPPLDNRFQVRESTYTESEQRAIYEANKQVYAGTFGDTPTDDEDYHEFILDNPQYQHWTVVDYDDRLAGFVLSQQDGPTATINEVSVLPAYRRHGLARWMLMTNMRELRQSGVEEVTLVTDAAGGSGARQLYTSLGFASEGDEYRYRKLMQ